jgi:hypothetical protein
MVAKYGLVRYGSRAVLRIRIGFSAGPDANPDPILHLDGFDDKKLN